MSVTTAISAGRRAAEARMLDTVEIKYPTGWTVVEGVEVRAYDEDRTFETRARIKVSNTQPHVSIDAARIVSTVTRELHIPIDCPAVEPGAVAEVIAVDASSDPTLLGAILTLDGPAPGSQTTARRMQVSEVLS